MATRQQAALVCAELRQKYTGPDTNAVYVRRVYEDHLDGNGDHVLARDAEGKVVCYVCVSVKCQAHISLTLLEIVDGVQVYVTTNVPDGYY